MRSKRQAVDSLYLFLLVMVFFLIYVITFTLSSRPENDFSVHLATISSIGSFDLIQLWKAVNYPLWHTLVGFLFFVIKLPIAHSSALITALFGVFSFLVCRQVLMDFASDSVSRAKINIFSFILMFVVPIYVPWFNGNLYLGQGSPTVWHNPTCNAVKPFALLSTYLFIKLYQQYGTKPFKNVENPHKEGLALIGFASIVTLSVMAKPSFLMAFIPAIGLFLIFAFIKNGRNSLAFAAKIVSAFILPVFLFGIQYLLIYKSGNSTGGLALAFFDIWRLYSPNIVVSFMLASAFPLYVLFFQGKNNLKNNGTVFVFMYLVVSILEYGLLKETGPRMGDGNFGWSYIHGLFLFYVFMTISFLNYEHALEESSKRLKLKKAFVGLGYIIIFSQFVFGIYYYLQFLFNGNVW